MQYMLCRNRVADYHTWRAVFDSDAAAHREAGLILANVWRESEEPNTIHFLFEVRDRPKAMAFINAPDAESHARRSGVRDGSYTFLESLPPY